MVISVWLPFKKPPARRSSEVTLRAPPQRSPSPGRSKVSSSSRVAVRRPGGCFRIPVFSVTCFSFFPKTHLGLGSRLVVLCHVCSMPCKRHWPANGRTGGLPAELSARTGRVSSVPSLPHTAGPSLQHTAQAPPRTRPVSSVPSFAEFSAYRRWSGFKCTEFAAYRASAAGGEMAERAACRVNCRDDLDCR